MDHFGSESPALPGPVVGAKRAIPDEAIPDAGADLLLFDELFTRDYRRVVALAAVLSGDRGLAEDLAQEAFAAAQEKWARIGNYDDPGAWVRRVVANRASSACRRRGRERRARSCLETLASTHDEQDSVVRREFWVMVRELPRRQAQCVALHYLEDLKVDEIAKIPGISSSTVRVHLFEGRRELARRIQDEEGTRGGS